jgi:hypothetical protein
VERAVIKGWRSNSPEIPPLFSVRRLLRRRRNPIDVSGAELSVKLSGHKTIQEICNDADLEDIIQNFG